MTDGPSIPTPPAGSRSLVDRVKNIIMTPKTEWGVIDGEAATVGGLYTGYIMILAAIGPIATLIGHQLVGIYGWKPPMEYSIAWALISYVLGLVSCYVSALVIDGLAPSFGGTKNFISAFKVAAYSGTAAWLAGIFAIVPMLGFLAILGLYSLYLLYLGLPRLMRVSEDKAVGYTVVVIIVQIILYALVFYLVGMIVLMIVGPALVGPVVVRY